jgi:hypothetical protein
MAGLIIWAAFSGTLAPTYHRLMISVTHIDRSVTMLIALIAAVLEVL